MCEKSENVSYWR